MTKHLFNNSGFIIFILLVMSLPFFYIEKIVSEDEPLFLNEETSRHVAQVLRMQNGEQLQLTDGKGKLVVAAITDNNKKKCTVQVLSSTAQPAPKKNTLIAISLIKNAHRFEWFLEKATEIGVSEIIPLLCSRTEKQHFRTDRLQGILISAMLQSQQAWLPVLHAPVKFIPYVQSLNAGTIHKKFIAHCREDEPRIQLAAERVAGDSIILIGPEGDFTSEEIEVAVASNFSPVALGDTRLRTETAGVVAATILAIG